MPFLIVIFVYHSSSEKRRALDEPIQSTQGPFKGLQSSQQASSPVRSNIKPEELTESSIELQSPEQSEKPSEKKDEKAEDTTQKLGRTCLIDSTCTTCTVCTPGL